MVDWGLARTPNVPSAQAPERASSRSVSAGIAIQARALINAVENA
jgi:hypothetical protein